MNDTGQSNGCSCSDKKNKCATVHFVYIIGILVVIIILISAFKFGENDALKDILNFALGFTSLVLAVVAIVYAFVANNSFAGTVTKIETAASSIKEETKDLEQSLKKVEAVVNSIPQSLEKIAGGIDKTNKILESKPESELSPPAQPNDANVIAFATGVVDRFMTSTSWNGLKLLYLCDRATKTDITFDLRDWTSIDPTISFDYAYGFLVSSASAGFVFLTDNNGIVKIHSLPTIVSEKLPKEITRRMGKEVRASEWATQIKAIENFVIQQEIKSKVTKPVVPT